MQVHRFIMGIVFVWMGKLALHVLVCSVISDLYFLNNLRFIFSTLGLNLTSRNFVLCNSFSSVNRELFWLATVSLYTWLGSFSLFQFKYFFKGLTIASRINWCHLYGRPCWFVGSLKKAISFKYRASSCCTAF